MVRKTRINIIRITHGNTEEYQGFPLPGNCCIRYVTRTGDEEHNTVMEPNHQKTTLCIVKRSAESSALVASKIAGV